jgi:uncharacterized lipoprotein YbaY
VVALQRNRLDAVSLERWGETMIATDTLRKAGIAAALVFTCCGIASAQAAAPQEQNNVRAAVKWKRFDYICENGAKVTVYLHDNTAKVRFQDHIYMMRQTPSADGNRYSDGKVVWWGKGDGGFLQEDAPDGDGKVMVKDCAADEASTTANTLTGTVTYLARMALPPQTVIQIQLQDVSRADAPATIIAQEKFTLGERQVPVPFTLKYNPAKIDDKHTYTLIARVSIGTELKFTTDQAFRVLTQGNPTKVDLILKPAGGKP